MIHKEAVYVLLACESPLQLKIYSMNTKELIIRDCTLDDAAALAEIYAPYVTHTAITFEYEPPTAEEFRQRIEATKARFPYLVAELGGRVVGYVYAGVFNARRAARHCATTSIYIANDCHGCGVGKALYAALEERLRRMGIINLIASITWTDTPDEYLTHNSPEFHRHMGFTQVAHLHRVGYKFGRWYDLLFFEKLLDEKDGCHGEDGDE